MPESLHLPLNHTASKSGAQIKEWGPPGPAAGPSEGPRSCPHCPLGGLWCRGGRRAEKVYSWEPRALGWLRGRSLLTSVRSASLGDSGLRTFKLELTLSSPSPGFSTGPGTRAGLYPLDARSTHTGCDKEKRLQRWPVSPEGHSIPRWRTLPSSPSLCTF